jgi:hypothetical protein
MPSKSVPTKTTLKDFSIDQKKSGEFLLAEFNQLYELWRYIDKRIENTLNSIISIIWGNCPPSD